MEKFMFPKKSLDSGKFEKIAAIGSFLLASFDSNADVKNNRHDILMDDKVSF